MRHFRLSLAASLSMFALAVGGCGGGDAESTDTPPAQTGGSAGTGGAAGAGTGGTAGEGGSAGTAGQAGKGGSAGSAGQAGEGGSAGAAGQAGEGGSAGAAGQAGEGGSAGAAGAGGSAPVDHDKDGADSTVDCDDDDATVNPSAVEVCDEKDNNCTGGIDEGLTKTKYYPDGDKDGHGSETGMVEACAAPGEYYATQPGDCDDGNPAVNLGATELCDAVDNDCDTQVDEGVTTTYFVDADGDGYGLDAAGTNKAACWLPTGYAAVAGDCDDTKAARYPGADEICDGLDNDCDTQVDEGVTKNTYHPDTDKDGYGANVGTVQGCAAPAGSWSLQGGDCDDSDQQRYPGNTEVCDGKDNDCNVATPEPGLGTYYLDSDKDGFGSTKTTKACALPAGYVTNSLDCDDNSAAVNPTAIEFCDGIDNNCVGGIDEGPVETWPDVDQDGFGDAAAPSTFHCGADSSHVTNNKDCNDAEAAINPDAVEVPGNGIDDNCDGTDTPIGTVCGHNSYAVTKLPYLSINNSLSTTDNQAGNPAGAAFYWDDYEISTVAGNAFTALMHADDPVNLSPRMYLNTDSCGPTGFAINTGWFSRNPAGSRRARQIVEPTVSGYYYQVLTTMLAGQTGGYDYEVVPGKLGTSCGNDDAGIWPLGFRETNQLLMGDTPNGSPVPAGYLTDNYEFFLRANQTYTLLYGGMTYSASMYLSQAGDCETSLGHSIGGILRAGARYVYTPTTDDIYVAWLTTTSTTASGDYTFNVVPGNVGESCFAGAGTTAGAGDTDVIYPLGGSITQALGIGDRIDTIFGNRFFDDFETWLEKGESVTIIMTTLSGGFIPRLMLASGSACTAPLVTSAQSSGNMAVLTYTAPAAGIYVIMASSHLPNQTGTFTLSTQVN